MRAQGHCESDTALPTPHSHCLTLYQSGWDRWSSWLDSFLKMAIRWLSRICKNYGVGVWLVVCAVYLLLTVYLSVRQMRQEQVLTRYYQEQVRFLTLYQTVPNSLSYIYSHQFILRPHQLLSLQENSQSAQLCHCSTG